MRMSSFVEEVELFFFGRTILIHSFSLIGSREFIFIGVDKESGNLNLIHQVFRTIGEEIGFASEESVSESGVTEGEDGWILFLHMVFEGDIEGLIHTVIDEAFDIRVTIFRSESEGTKRRTDTDAMIRDIIHVEVIVKKF